MRSTLRKGSHYNRKHRKIIRSNPEGDRLFSSKIDEEHKIPRISNSNTEELLSQNISKDLSRLHIELQSFKLNRWHPGDKLIKKKMESVLFEKESLLDSKKTFDANHIRRTAKQTYRNYLENNQYLLYSDPALRSLNSWDKVRSIHAKIRKSLIITESPKRIDE